MLLKSQIRNKKSGTGALSVIPALGKLRQDGHKLMVSLGYNGEVPILKKNRANNIKNMQLAMT